MKRLLNTLYLTTPDAYLSKDGTNVVISSQQKILFRMPIQNIQSIITFGYQGASPGLMRLCSENGVALSFFTTAGRFVARVQGPQTGNILLRRSQFQNAGDTDYCRRLASSFVLAKIHNARMTLRRFVRDYPSDEGVSAVADAAESLKNMSRLITRSVSVDEVRGHEGQAASIYFGVMHHLILNKDRCFAFARRVKHPPTDCVNAMLSFGYTLLAHDCGAALEGVGLDPYMGVLHSVRPGRMSLALDLMEEFRSWLVDRFVISLINTRHIRASDFTPAAGDGAVGSVSLTEDGRKKYLTMWQNRKKTEIIHPFLQEKVPIGLLPHIQALLLTRYMRGDMSDYAPFLVK
ncbi:type I-C CRISPR-associated endonuclease Cas1c [Paramuribaculum intestinale]|uniref:type I-C CRISPR-associated endonuclease Cas1c n=1 Tax=Paramuribaculum intestinale TaxID=2094151 RepID=UPI0025AA0F43|nr:type I-C CRISPR-associated endonuclease Cas1c [Paramuribaculum intestinale]